MGKINKNAVDCIYNLFKLDNMFCEIGNLYKKSEKKCVVSMSYDDILNVLALIKSALEGSKEKYPFEFLFACKQFDEMKGKI